jgi:hypothetical protein
MKAFDKKWKLCTTNERVRQEMAEFDEADETFDAEMKILKKI